MTLSRAGYLAWSVWLLDHDKFTSLNQEPACLGPSLSTIAGDTCVGQSNIYGAIAIPFSVCFNNAIMHANARGMTVFWAAGTPLSPPLTDSNKPKVPSGPDLRPPTPGPSANSLGATPQLASSLPTPSLPPVPKAAEDAAAKVRTCHQVLTSLLHVRPVGYYLYPI